MNVGFGNGGFANRGQDFHAIANTKSATEVAYPRARNSAESKLAGVMIKAMDSMSFNYTTFAYHFLEKAPGPVIENTMRLFDAILDGLVQRFDLDQCQDNGEYNSAVMAKRIQEALERYK